MRVAVVHDWLTGNRGGEKVLAEILDLLPEATVFTLFHFAGSVPPSIERHPIRTTFLQGMTSPARNYRPLLPLFAPAAGTWDLSGFDLVVSTSHCVAKNARKAPGAFHLSYVHTPVRYLHDLFETYFEGSPRSVRAAARLVRAPLAAWDVRTARRPDALLANSANVARRIRRLWGRDAVVVAPPVDTLFYTPAPRERSGLLVVSALVPYKRVADAVAASAAAGFPLTIAGRGPQEALLRRQAGASVRFAGSPDDEGLRDLYRAAEAVLMPGEEDFGIVPVEAMACGTPVVALARGGALETVEDGVTGVLYPREGPEGLVEAVGRLLTLHLDPGSAVLSAARFSRAAFRDRFLAAAREALGRGGRRDLADALPSDGPEQSTMPAAST